LLSEGLAIPNRRAIINGKNMDKNFRMINSIGPFESFEEIATIANQKAF